jgi:hypothetical protein
MPRTDIRPVRARSELKAFIRLAWDIYADDPQWVPPLRSEQAGLLTPGKHPFWHFSSRELFVAWRANRPVGRIAAIVDGNHNARHGEQMGVWGFFECRNDPEAAAGLFRAAEEWLAAQGMAFARGPMNPSLNYEAGLLIEGFDSPPVLMMTYNQPYYAELVTLCGYRKEKDLLAFRVQCDTPLPAWAITLAARVAERGEFTIVKGVRRRFTTQLKELNLVYNECWSRNWGFVPMTEQETLHAAKLLKHFVDTDLVFFVYRGEEPVAVCMLLPDINPLLRRFNGSLGVRALVASLLHRSDVTGLRGLIFGVKEEYRQMGLPFFVFDYLLKVLAGKPQYRTVELGWNLEDNSGINLLYEEGGLRADKRYRLFRKELPDGARRAPAGSTVAQARPA